MTPPNINEPIRPLLSPVGEELASVYAAYVERSREAETYRVLAAQALREKKEQDDELATLRREKAELDAEIEAMRSNWVQKDTERHAENCERD